MTTEARCPDQVSPERWLQVKSIFEAALELDPMDRVAYLDTACSGDEELRERVDSLLSSDEQGWDLLEKPAFEAAADLLAEDQPELSEGEQIGHYKVVSLLGVGGMGHVYLAEDAKLGRKVALKLLPTSYTRDGSRLRRFQQEARSASALNHPNILTIHELGEVGGRQFIATEFVEGETLREHLRRGPLNLPETLDIAIQIAGALAAAHKAGIVHRDIKPENIMLRHDGYIKVLDFGLAKLTEQHEPTSEAHAAKNVNVSSGLVMGTVKYMSPEQAQGLPVDPRSDIFSLGVVLYEMLAGHAPFHGESNSDLILSILTRDPAPIAEFVPNAAIEIQAVVNKALRKSVDRRYQSSSEMIVDLKAIARSLTLVTETTNSAYPPYAQIAQQANGPAPSSGQRISEEEKPSEKVLGLEYRLQRPGRLELRSGATLIANDGLTPVRSEGQSAPPKGTDIWTGSIAKTFVAEIRQHKMSSVLLFITLAIGILGLVYGLPRWIGKRQSSFQEMRITRVSDSKGFDRGPVSWPNKNAAISPNGNYVARVVDEHGQRSLWVQELQSNISKQIIPAEPVDYTELLFSPESNYIYYITFDKQNSRTLYQVPTDGGASKKLIDNVVFAALSPDGKRFAFVPRRSSLNSGESRPLMLANVDGTEEKKLALRNAPDAFGPLSWSPDGRRIACGAFSYAGWPHQDVIEVRLEDGMEQPISSQRWEEIDGLAWLADGSGLIMTAREQGNAFRQLWQVSYPTREARRITNDLDDYSEISLTADSSKLVAIQQRRNFNIWVAPASNPDDATQITFSNEDGYNGLSWTPDDKIVYSSAASGNHEIWIMDPDRSNRRQLTLGGGSFWPAVSADGRFVFFVSTRARGQNTWRMDIDGNNAKQLTTSNADVWPHSTPDGRWVVYASLAPDRMTLCKVPVDGGVTRQMSKNFASQPVTSPDGKLLAFRVSNTGVVITPFRNSEFNDGDSIAHFDILSYGATPYQWSPDGRALCYVADSDAVSNLWSQPIDAGPPTQLTKFKSDHIAWFDWSRDGKRIALARGAVTRDVVLISDFR
jgi:serine/threonine protein kinase/Tol biopolymer transport system component